MGMSFQEQNAGLPPLQSFRAGGLSQSADSTYSTGMFLRLAFAISTTVEPEILIMDEMISTGDAEFH